jgi:hypothetical protein
MLIDGKITEGYVVVCSANHEDHFFVLETIDISVECPRCGHSALGTELLAEFYCNGRDSSSAQELAERRTSTNDK